MGVRRVGCSLTARSIPLGLQMKSTEDQDSSDIIFDEVRERPLATPEVGIFPDGPSVHPSSENLNLNSEEEGVGKNISKPKKNWQLSHDTLLKQIITDFREKYVSLRLRMQNAVSPQPCVGKF